MSVATYPKTRQARRGRILHIVREDTRSAAEERKGRMQHAAMAHGQQILVTALHSLLLKQHIDSARAIWAGLPVKMLCRVCVTNTRQQ